MPVVVHVDTRCNDADDVSVSTELVLLLLVGTELRSIRLLIGGMPLSAAVDDDVVLVVVRLDADDDNDDGGDDVFELLLLFLSESHMMECFAMMIGLETFDIVCTVTYLSGATWREKHE